MRPTGALPRLCVTATGETPQQLLDSARRGLQQTRMVELRLDWLPRPEEGLALIPRLLETSGAAGRTARPVLQATCRRRPNGGKFRGSVARQLAILERAAQAGCRVLDLEMESAEAAGPDAVANLRRSAELILSFHDFERTPPLEGAARRLLRFPADFYKIVPTATRQSDNCRALDFLRAAVAKDGAAGRWICFCMGESGVPSRVLSLARGGDLLYAAAPGSAAAAPGQPDAETLQERYRVTQLGPQTAVYGLLGYPVGHSLGAAIHNAAFRSRGLDAVYLPLLCRDLQDFRKAAARYPLSGFSITIPHKQAILPLVDRMDRAVRAAGAANTVRVRKGRWEAINTDVEGITTPLRETLRLGQDGVLPSSFRGVIVGNGGAARAAAAALRSLRCRRVWVAGRNPARVRRLARETGAAPLSLQQLAAHRFDLLIHATSVGMWPHSGDCLLQPEQVNAETVFDLVYNPLDTALLQIARQRGSRTIPGLEMFLAQAARQFEFWTGQEAPRRLMRRVAAQEILSMIQTPLVPVRRK